MMMNKYNCPNCAAPISGDSCPYCGTVIYDFAAIQLGKPSFVKVIHENMVMMFRLMVDDFQVNIESDTVEYNAAGTPFYYTRGYDVGISLEGHAVKMVDSGEPLVTVIMEDKNASN